jgi:hypothetical protein
MIPAMSPPPSPSRALVVVLLVVLAGGLWTVRTTGPRDGGPDPSGGAPAPAGTPQAGLPDPPAGARALTLPDRSPDGRVWPARAGRPPVATTPSGENRHALEPAVVSGAWVSGRVADRQVLVADVALPWAYWLDPAVPDLVDEAVVHEAMSAWDDVPGSRWAVAFAGYAEPGTHPTGSRSGRAVADGRSTVFAEDSCEGLTTANAYLFADGGLGVDRYSTRASQILEADIGICPRAVDPVALRLALVHEVGHVVGLAHLCDPADDCWRDGMGEGPHGCRVMFWQARPCQVGLDDADRLSVATTYPVLRPLWGPTPAEAVARVSFALWDDGQAPAAVVVDDDVAAPVLAAAATAAARLGGPLLLGAPDDTGCLAGPAAREVNRVLRRRGVVVLVGAWPATCARTAYDWDVLLRTVDARDGASASRDLADLTDALTAAGGSAASTGPEPAAADGPEGPGVAGGADGADRVDGVVVWAGGPGAAAGAAVAAAGLAAGRGVPLLVAGADDGDLAGWLRGRGVRDAVVLGPDAEAVLPGLAVAVPDVATLPATDGVDLSLRAAELALAARARGADAAPSVLLVGVDDGRAAMAAVPAAARADGVVVASTPEVDPRITAWLDRVGPAAGWVVGTDPLPPPATRQAYGALLDR